jgi:hypothetical protein
MNSAWFAFRKEPPMSLLRKSLDAVTLADLKALIEAGARETAELEFKGALPFQAQRNQPEKTDRWIEKGDRVGDYARDEILAEIVAFANADGGTLVLGLHETKTEPRIAERLEPLPNCEGLAQRLFDATEDIIEPRLAAISVRAVPADDRGSGYILMRVGKSLSGPHRLTTTREFYIRRGEKTARMGVREIKDLTLDLARTGDRLEQVFLDRTSLARSLFVNLKREPDKVPPLLLKVTALPTIFQNISGITMRPNLWWQGKAFTMTLDGQGLQCAYPAREFGDLPKIRLRSFERDDRPLSRGTQRFIRGDGLVEFCFFLSTSEPSQRSGTQSILFVGWLVSLVVGAMAQVEHLRRNLAWDAVDFGLQIEIWSDEPIAVVRGDHFFESNVLPGGARPFAFPRYAVGPLVDFDALVTAIVQDLFNACGASGNWPCTVPWSELLKDYP